MNDPSHDWTTTGLVPTDEPLYYRFSLYVVGATPRAGRAIVNLRELFERHLAGHYSLDIVDISQEPQIAVREQVVAVPMLVREEPAPVRRFVGDMSDTKRLLAGLGIFSNGLTL